jgi:hypothetical protein
MKCKYCQKLTDKKFCNKDCYYAYLKNPSNNPMFGKKHKKSSKTKQSEKRKNPIKRFCLICGKQLDSYQESCCSYKCKSKAYKKSGNPFYGKHHKKFTIESNRQKHIGKKASDETKRKMRISAIAYRKSIDPGWHPSYNKKACEYFRNFDNENMTNGQHAENGGEYYLEELGYYLDYINFDKKLIIEFNERRHYANGKLKEYDRIREKEIKNYFKDFNFMHIHEKEAQ